MPRTMGSTSQRSAAGMSRLNAMTSISTYTVPSRTSRRVAPKRRKMKPGPSFSGNLRWADVLQSAIS